MSRIAIRCDGGAAIGAGHVGRCVPIAHALRDRGCDVTFVGTYDGTAAWLIDAAHIDVAATTAGPLGLDPREWTAAIVDLYAAEREAELCALARDLPVATIGEATRCATSGIWIDYHAGSRPEAGPRRLGGPGYAPLDPRFGAARRAHGEVSRILVLTGASKLFDDTAARMANAAAHAFPDAEIVAPAHVAAAAAARVTRLDAPFDLVRLAPTIDLAVVGAGMTTYELATAGIPVVAVALVENQRVVLDGCRATGLALPVDGIDRDPLPDVAAALTRMQQSELRTELAATAVATVDGRGAERIAEAVLAAWTPGSQTHPGR